MIGRGRGARQPQRPRTKVQRLSLLLPATPRTTLNEPYYSPGCPTDPKLGQDKAKAAEAFKAWWAQLPPTDVTLFSDGSEQLCYDPTYKCGSQQDMRRQSMSRCTRPADEGMCQEKLQHAPR
ncbi:hypothetical protein EJ02DRAFT_455835 [Clathrospora elynae]|uniref:Uncharacterized protein n=1 Tax=Clathrospora elynae TaxID=706981 RepID=A0A6A5SUB8_9PLEO|nr:hypothetical protein EJ02DRAFT_455835 [Clathrospora elynae]